jgi:hypothetical protein
MIPAPKPWDEAYLKGCLEDEIALAALHSSWSTQRYAFPADLIKDADLCLAPRRGRSPTSPGMARITFDTTPTSPPPHWRRDWIAAGELSTQLGLSTYQDAEDGSVSVGAGNRRRNVTERYEDHPSKDAATWAAIVGAAIQKLEAGNT